MGSKDCPLSRRWCASRAAAAGLALLGTAALAADGAGAWPAGEPEYSVHLWQTEEGLPQNAVTAVVQTSDGYLWVGTYSGLARFDGDRFRVFDAGNTPALNDSRVTSLCEDAEGSLWIGHETGRVTRMRAGRFEDAGPAGAPPLESVVGMTSDRLGHVWALDKSGRLAALGNPSPPSFPAPAGAAPAPVALAADGEGGVWVDRAGAVSRVVGPRLEPAPWSAASPGSFVTGIGAATEGGLWVIVDGEVRRWASDRWAETWGACPWGPSAVTAVLPLKRGGVAVGTLDRGLFLLYPDRRVVRYSRDRGLPQDWIRTLFEDREGVLWAGVGSAGLAALRPASVAVADPPDAWRGRAVLTVAAARDGAMWVGTEGAGLYRWRDGAWTRFAEAEGVSNLFVWSVAEDRRGRIWAGTWGGGLLVRDQGRFAPAPGLESLTAPVTALLPAADGEGLWIGAGTGLLRWRPGGVETFAGRQGAPDAGVRAIAEGPGGLVWFGMSGGGLGCLDHGTVRRFLRSDGLSGNFVQCLLADPDGTLWIGTSDGGLVRLRAGRFSSLGAAEGLPNPVICHLADDGAGRLWISSHGGLFSAERAALNRCADGADVAAPFVALGRSSGMPTLECSGGLQPAGCRTPDGRLWFATSRGLVAVNPQNLKSNPLPPPVVIEEMRVDGVPFPLPTRPDGSPPEAPPGSRRFEFAYAGLSFAAPEKVRFRCRLDGMDARWADWGAGRAAVYNYLPPGAYVFHVSACNNDGVWNEAGAALAFSVRPHFWETWWFRTAAGAAGVSGAVLGAAGAARRRLRRHIERLDRQRAVERERSRIAQDIHDDLGASLTRITLLSQSVRADWEGSPEGAGHLDQIYRTARDVTRTMDEIVWAVNPRHDTMASLAGYLGRFAQEHLAAAGIRCRLNIPVELPDWALTADTRHNLFLACKEALNNAVKHSGAAEVAVSLTPGDDGFVLAVQDDGRGFDPAGAAADPAPAQGSGGLGLANMRRRLAELGGRCEIASGPGRGTVVRFHVAARAGAVQDPLS